MKNFVLRLLIMLDLISAYFLKLSIGFVLFPTMAALNDITTIVIYCGVVAFISSYGLYSRKVKALSL